MSDQIDRDHERTAELCRQAALPMLRQRPALVVPESKRAEADAQSKIEEQCPADSRLRSDPAIEAGWKDLADNILDRIRTP